MKNGKNEQQKQIGSKRTYDKHDRYLFKPTETIFIINIYLSIHVFVYLACIVFIDSWFFVVVIVSIGNIHFFLNNENE